MALQRVDDSDLDKLIYANGGKGWRRSTRAAKEEYLSTSHGSPEAGSSVTLRFNGTSVEVKGTVLKQKQGSENSQEPLAIFVLDFASETTYNGNPSNNTVYSQRFYFNSSLSAGEHSLTMTLVDPDVRLWLDYIDYTPLPVTPASSTTTGGATATNQSQNDADTSGGVSKGLVAGISILAAILTALTVLGLVWWFLRRKRMKQDSEATQSISYYTHPSHPTSPVQSESSLGYFQPHPISTNPPDEYRKPQIPSRHVVNQSSSVGFVTGAALLRETSIQLPHVGTRSFNYVDPERSPKSPIKPQNETPVTPRHRAYSSTTWSEYTTSLNSDTYHASGLLEVNLNATLEHPIHILIERSRLLWEQKVAKQSKSLKEAVTEYQRRHSGRAPPLGFEKWWKYAKENNVQLLDEYDQIWRDVEVFWGFDTTALSVSQDEYLQKSFLEESGIYVIGKDNWEETIDIFTLTSNSTEPNNTHELSTSTYGGTTLIKLLRDAGVEEHIPPFRIIMNPDDRPIIQRDWALWDRAVRSARIGSVLPRAMAEAPMFGQGWLSSCNPHDSAAWYTPIDYKERPPTRGMPKTFIHDHSPAMDPCAHPHLFRTHGQFLSYDGGRGPNLPQYDSVFLGAEEELGWVGVVSYSPTKLHADITAAIPYDWEEDAEDLDLGDGWEWSWEEGDTSKSEGSDGEGHKEDQMDNSAAKLTADGDEAQNIINTRPSGEPLRWALKGVDERLHWRGSNTGMWHGEGMDWNLAHRLRMMDMLQVIDHSPTPEGFPEPNRYPEKLPALSMDSGRSMVTIDRAQWINSSMDVSFAGVFLYQLDTIRPYVFQATLRHAQYRGEYARS
ncbi:hypothetical protein AAF712_011801 [Marasmius tenuissimus]|uniref:Uncharacterized protein n=1 Tax=Marasmius tenuissimus TaxID=585030 RepID=A0ABR2ZJI6_9AGAR